MENSNIDQFNETSNRPASVRVALVNGIYMGLALIIVSLIFYLLDIPRENPVQYLSFVVLIVLTIIFVKQWRDQYNGGYLTYGGAFSHGFLVILFGVILAGIYTFIFFQFIAPGEIQVILDETEQKLYSQGMADEQIEMAMKWTRMMTKPWAMAIWGIVVSTIVGLIVSAIVAIFMKKEPKEF